MFVKGDKVTISEMAAMSGYIEEQLKGLRENLKDHADVPTPHKVIAVAGTPTVLAAIDQGLPFDAKAVHGYDLSLQTIQSWIMKLASMPLSERKLLAGMEEKRADVIVAGLLTLLQSAEIFQLPKIEVSVRGLRYGIAKQISTGRLKV
jgi:exopolyphosphatase/guanosine-5'-triphosphate,3'-diphosphate pyrophosphatase